MVIYRAVAETEDLVIVKRHSKECWLKVLRLNCLVRRADGKLDFQQAFFGGRWYLFSNATLTLKHKDCPKMQ